MERKLNVRFISIDFIKLFHPSAVPLKRRGIVAVEVLKFLFASDALKSNRACDELTG